MVEKKLQDLPIGIQNFEVLRTKNLLYVDKTKEIYEIARLITPCFLSRPRRFGKSMLCSTLKALFEGKKNLFAGTWIASSDWEWQEFPVVHLDFNALKYDNPGELKEQIEVMIHSIAKQYDVTLDPLSTPGNSLSHLIAALAKAKKTQVVVLIDEYDRPIINSLDNLEELKQYRDILYSCYTPLKSLDVSLRFLLITGVSQFAKVSIFSALNHLESLSASPHAATICGYTQKELEHTFADYIEKARIKFALTHEQMLVEIKRWYNGYCFTIPDDAPERVYNPFSIINFFKAMQFKNYWFTSGNPSFAINYFKHHTFKATDFEQVIASESDLDALEPEALRLTTLLYQEGSLTIKKYDAVNAAYELGFPNHEVAKACMDGLLFDTEKRTVAECNIM